MRVFLILLWAVSWGTLTSGCQTYQAGTPGRTVGEFTDDMAIQAKIKTRLWADSLLSGWFINTDVYRGVVTLSGHVASKSLKQHATEVCGGIRGVVKVNNQLQVSE